MIELPHGLEVHESALHYRATRNSGPGGQNVNQVATRIELFVSLDDLRGLDEARRARLEDRLGSRLDKDGVLRIVSQAHRTQAQNRRVALERLRQILADALHRDRARVKTRPTRGSKRRRLQSKRLQSQKKSLRRRPSRDD